MSKEMVGELTQAAIVLGIIGGIVYCSVIGQQVGDFLIASGGVIVGFYFQGKAQANAVASTTAALMAEPPKVQPSNPTTPAVNPPSAGS